MKSILSKEYQINTLPSTVFKLLTDRNQIRYWFPEIYLSDNKNKIEASLVQSNGFEYILTIKNKIINQRIQGEISSTSDKNLKIYVEFILNFNHNYKKPWTLLKIKCKCIENQIISSFS